MKTILLFGAGKSATVLIHRMLIMCERNGWHLNVADMDQTLIESKIRASIFATAITLSVQDDQARKAAIRNASIVISLLPPALHFLIAVDCLESGKSLLTASYADDNLRLLDMAVKARGLLFLCEMGLDPGIDHMSAMQLLHGISKRGGVVKKFFSHCGGLVAPESDDNPWHYKISWNPANIVRAGSDGAVFLLDGKVRSISHEQVFSENEYIDFPGLGLWQTYPNRDSLKYIKLYNLESASTFIRTTIRHPEFIKGWKAIVASGLTNPNHLLSPDQTFQDWAKPLRALVNDDNSTMLAYLGFWDDQPVGPGNSSAKVLQSMLESKLMMHANDRDMVLMLHQADYLLNGRRYIATSSLELKGDDALHTAMAKTVGLPLAHAAELILKNELLATGVQIPTMPEIYERILPLLDKDGIIFHETENPAPTS